MREIIITLIESKINDECPYGHTPNEETLKAIKEAKSRKGLKKYKEFFAKLDI